MREPILFVIIKILVTTTLFCHQPSQGEVIYVSPSHSCLVQSNPCHSLNQLATNSSKFGSNTTLIFLPGVHTLSVELSIFNNISYLSLLTESSSEQSTSVVVCQRDAGFNFHGLTHIYMHVLKLLGCKCNIVSVQHLSIKNSTFQGEKDSESALEIIATNANIINSIFIFNRVGKCLTINFQLNITLPTLVGGAILAKQHSNITIVGSRFESNVAEMGGAIFANTESNIKIFNSSFIDNYVTVANITIKDSHSSSSGIAKLYRSSRLQTFVMDLVQSCSTRFNGRLSMGGAIALLQSTLLVDGCIFSNNTSKLIGAAGVLAVQYDSVVNIYNSEFFDSHVGTFGGFSTISGHSYMTVDNSTICNSSAQQGGVVFIDSESYLTIRNSVLCNNTASGPGGVIVSDQNSHVNISSSKFFENKADSGGMFLASISVLSIKGNNTLFSMNKARKFGGVVKIFRSTLMLYGDCIFTDNQAIAGGAIYAEESILNFNGKITFKFNVASTTGGGLYLYHSRLNCKYESTVNVLGNRANHTGGGIYAANSFITVYYNRFSRVGSFVYFIDNVAHMGGGIYLESAAQLRIYKTGEVVTFTDHTNETRPVSFDSNSADFGNAIYIRDETYFDVCSRSVHSSGAYITSTECVIQVLSSQATFNHQYELISIDFAKTNHSETVESTIIYGGLLDRCTLNHHAEVRIKYIGKIVHVYGVTYLKLISNLKDTSRIASAAVRLCFCTPFENKPDCSYALPQVNVMKGERFNISLVAVDQVNHTVENVIVYSSLNSSESGLGYGQLAQKTTNACTNLSFSISSPHSHERLILYADGPCRNVSRSQSRLSVAFKRCKCPKIGFQPKCNDSKAVTCECECDSRLYPYITKYDCNYETGMLTRNGNFWITYIDDQITFSGFIIYSHCPLDYCLPNVPVNLNIFNGFDDSQCANNRSGTLCGVCQSHLSLSFGSSLCLQCSTVWYKTFPALLIIIFVVGIALVSLLLALNLTVAVGTLNGLIFYANILGANGGIIISSSTKVPSLFISWLNLEVGFDICLFEGMDTYWKTWLQLAFPSYVILLVIVIIIVSNHSIKFSQLLAKRNPVATLATLILLSYTMFLRTAIAVLSFAELNYPDGSHRWVWLHDGTVDYLRGKHIALLVVAISILIVGVVYTALLFFWPWLLHHQNKVVFRCIRSQKLHHFMAPYHAPYNIDHRYWTGLLLFVRVALYLVFTLNASNDPGVNLLAIAVLGGAVLFLRARVGRIYQSNVIDWIEMMCYSNAILFSSVQLYLLKAGSKEAIDVTSYVSGVIIMMLFLTIILYHMWRECGTKCLKMCKQRMVPEQNLLFDENDENLADYPPANNTKATPTFTVVERPTDCGTFQASSNKQVQRSNSSPDDANVSLLST